jgi:hypothetical protein
MNAADDVVDVPSYARLLAHRLGLGRPAVRVGALGLAAAVTISIALPPEAALAGGGPENAVLVVDPSVPESLYVANHYRAARGIPGSNVLYMPPGAVDYEQFTDFQLDALLGTLGGRGLDDHVDYVVVPPGGSFYVAAKELIDGGGCPAPVRRIAISTAYGLAYSSEEILAGGLRYSEGNRYYGKGFMGSEDPLAFDSRTTWLNGAPSNAGSARRYFIGFMLGYSGERGNTVEDTIRMINRSVAADGSAPAGTFYFMRTDDIRSTPRHPHFPSTINKIRQLGGEAEEIYKVDDKVAIVPAGRDDILGVMTGHSSPNIDDSDMTILPGAFADHLTSFAATFDTSSQRKMSRWIANGASGTMGTVEEPCVFGTGVTGKFPHPWLNVWYLQGMSLGESLFRSLQWAPFQSLFYGDPLTQPYAAFPTVSVEGVPGEATSGMVAFVPSSPEGEGPDVGSFDLYVDGRLHGTVVAEQPFVLDTTLLADGYHDLRVVAYAVSDVRTQGRWLGSLLVDNSGRSVTLDAQPASGNLDTEFQFDVTADGGDVMEIRLVQNERVVAASPGAAATLAMPASVLGAGIVELRAVADYSDGRTAFSAPLTLSVAFESNDGPRVGQVARPVAHSYTAYVGPEHTTLVDVPGYDAGGSGFELEITGEPEQAAIVSQGKAHLLRPLPDAAGTDSFVYRTVTGTVASDPATVMLRYCLAPEVSHAPSDTEACPGRSARLEVVAEGEDLGYQWFKDGLLLEGETGSVLEIDRVAADDYGSYGVDVRSWCGTPVRHVTAGPASLARPDDPRECVTDAWLPVAYTGRR